MLTLYTMRCFLLRRQQTIASKNQTMPANSNRRPNFDQWFEQLKHVAVQEFGFREDQTEDAFDPAAWLDYYNDELTPSQALEEDLKNS